MNKKSVLLYCDLIHTIEPLTDEEAGRLFKHYLRYINGLNPTIEDRILSLLFEQIKLQIERDHEKYKIKCLKNKENADMRWHANASERMQADAKHADTDTDNGTDIDKDIVKFNFKQRLLELGYDENLVKDWLEVRKRKKATNTETALNGFHKQVTDTGRPINEILKLCVENSWQGFNKTWLKNITNEPHKPTISIPKGTYTR